jgi:hypothetical protein
MNAAVVKNLVRLTCVLIVALLGGCGGIENGSIGESVASDAPAADTRLVMDGTAWDEGDWAD